MQPIAVAYKEVELLEKSNPNSSIGIQLEGEGVVYGPEAVIKKLLESHPSYLRGSQPALVRPKVGSSSVSGKAYT